MVFKVVVDPAALEDIDEATRYIAAQGNPERAMRWKVGALSAIGSLREFSMRCAVIPEAVDLDNAFRHLHYHSHQIVFEIYEEDRTVVVARVYHVARRALRLSDLP